MTALLPVRVGATPFPLRSSPLARGPLGFLPRREATAGTSCVVLDGPPYANGAPHLGHVLNKHLKDAVARAAWALGDDVAWRPGWDCHGLPLELAVERDGADRSDRRGFVMQARAYAQRQVDVQAAVFQAQGWAAAWDDPWRTMDPAMEAGTLRVLARLLERGCLDVRWAAVPWCPACGSTLSGAETEARPVTGEAWTVPFELEDDERLLSWTTTPWTLPLHRGLVVHPEATYVALVLRETMAWVSEATADRWAQALGATRTGRTRLGSAFVGRTYRTPWAEGTVVGDARVAPDAGTGVLHAVPGLAELDTLLGHDQGWPLVAHLTVDGRVALSPLAELNGLKAGPEADEAVRAAYADRPFFLAQTRREDAPHCWRHHVPLLTRASRQVFLHLDDATRARADAWVAQTAFTPATGRARLVAAMRSRPDWCLSRQRTWGVPMALFLDRATGQPHARAAAWMRRVADAVAEEGVSAWWQRPDEAWLLGEADRADLERVDDVLDVWFDSGCVPQLLGPAQVVVEGTDQHRGWFQSCLWVAAALDAPCPFERVVTHGFVVGGDGRKLSKSLGGDAAGAAKGPQPPAWSDLPTDVVRTWALAGSDGADKVWSLPSVQAAQAAVARWRGVVRFLLANALAPDERRTPARWDDVPAWDRYWVLETQRMAQDVLEAVREGRTGEAVGRAVRWGDTFSAVALGSWKDRLYVAPAGTDERQAVDQTVRACLLAWARALDVLTPRLMAEARTFWPEGLHPAEAQDAVVLDGREREEVEQVLALRERLAETAEALAQAKVPPGRRRLVGAHELPAWPGQLLADALDVGQVRGTSNGKGQGVKGPALEASDDPVCPRCRRAQPAWEGLACRACQARCC